MTTENNDRFREVDDDGIRLAPVPLAKSRTHVLPSVRQEFIIEPSLHIPETSSAEPKPETEKDFQPAKTEKNRRWKTKERLKNVVPGIVIFIISAAVVLPYVLGVFGVKLEFMPFKYDLDNFNAIQNIVNAFKISGELGWSGVGFVWVTAVPDILLAFGIIFVAVNILNAVIGVFGGVKPRRYLPFTVPYLIVVLGIFVASLIGVEAIGIEKIDFMRDFVYGFKDSELFSLLVFAAGNFLAALILRAVRPARSGYAA